MTAQLATKLDISKKRVQRERRGRELTLNMIDKKAPGYPVAMYIFKPLKNIGLTNTVLARELSYNAHSNMSMVRSGAARLPMTKAPKMASLIECDPYEFGRLVAENNMPDELSAMEELGLICSKDERVLLDEINKSVPVGDRPELIEKIRELISSQS